MQHDFKESLAKSHAAADMPFWIEVYRKAFGSSLASCVNVRNDGWGQRGGIDRVITLNSSKTIYVDEKIRYPNSRTGKEYSDIALEYLSSEERKIPGWVEKNLACDYIAYAFIESKKCYLLPFDSLRRCWFLNKNEWKKNFFHIRAKNNGYTTISLAVPINTLMESLKESMIIDW